MRNEIKTKCFYSNAIKVLLTFCVSVMCVFGMSSLYQSMAAISVNKTYDSVQAANTTHYFTAECTDDGNNTSTRYLKVVKTGATSGEANNLTVYEADSLAGAIDTSTALPSGNLNGTWAANSPSQGQETWTISVDETNYVAIDHLNAAAEINKGYNLPPLPSIGDTKFFTVSCTSAGNATTTKYLKVKKDAGEVLTVHVENTLDAVGKVTGGSTADWGGTWTADSPSQGQETWTIMTRAYSVLSNLDDAPTLASETYSNLDAALSANTTKYFSASCASSDGTVSTKYLKVVKPSSGNTLTVYEADSLAGAIAIDTSAQPSQASTKLSGAWTYESRTETWTISVDETNYVAIDNLTNCTEVATKVKQTYNKAQDEGTTKYFSIDCTATNGATSTTKYLKVVKTGATSGEANNLTVYEADSLAGAIAINTSTASPSDNLSGTWTSASGQETWTIALNGTTYIAVADLRDLECQSWGDLSVGTGLPSNAESYYKVRCKKTDGTYVDKYLRVQKGAGGALTVYSGNTLAEAKSASQDDSSHFAAASVVTGSAPYTETWYLGLVSSGEYSDIVSLSPLTTAIKSNKVWNGRENGTDYVAVDDGTVVQFALTGISPDPDKVFYVKKENGELKVSTDNSNYDYNLEYEGHTINAYLKPADNVSTEKKAEEWIITITGYEMMVDEGISAAKYKIEEQEIVASTQPWVCKGTNMVHTYAGAEQLQEYSVVYTLQLNGVSQAIAPLSGPFDIVKITKHVVDNKVIDIKVEGQKGAISDDSSEKTFATVANATATIGGTVVNMLASGDPLTITFNDSSTIRVDDIKGNVVTVNIHTGTDNALFKLYLSMDNDGKLAYHFKQLPLGTYLIDPVAEGHYDEIAVAESAPYRVSVTQTQS